MYLSLKQTATIITEAIQAGEADTAGIIHRVTTALGEQGDWLPKLAQRIHHKFGPGWATATQQDITHYIVTSRPFVSVWYSAARPQVIRLVKRPPEQRPLPPSLQHITLPSLPTTSDLAAWLKLPPERLDWLAAHWRVPAQDATAPHHHYLYKQIEKRDGRRRLIEIPKSDLRTVQRRILHGLLDCIPPHPAAHGFRKGKNTISYASPHTGKPVVIRLDLADFFTSIPAGRIFGLFHTLGYPENVARTLASLCTNRAPSTLLLKTFDRTAFHPPHNRQAYQRYLTRHLPQGAPTSPALANLCAYRLDIRLTALATSIEAHYTRYADDLAFSGGKRLARVAERLCIHVAAIALEEGFTVQHRKTRIMPQHTRQHLAGVIVNQHPNLSRHTFDTLKAILTNCIRHGPTSQNHHAHPDFQAHLAGRIAHAIQLNPARGRKLQTLFEQIHWP